MEINHEFWTMKTSDGNRREKQTSWRNFDDYKSGESFIDCLGSQLDPINENNRHQRISFSIKWTSSNRCKWERARSFYRFVDCWNETRFGQEATEDAEPICWHGKINLRRREDDRLRYFAVECGCCCATTYDLVYCLVNSTRPASLLFSLHQVILHSKISHIFFSAKNSTSPKSRSANMTSRWTNICTEDASKVSSPTTTLTI